MVLSRSRALQIGSFGPDSSCSPPRPIQPRTLTVSAPVKLLPNFCPQRAAQRLRVAEVLLKKHYLSTTFSDVLHEKRGEHNKKGKPEREKESLRATGREPLRLKTDYDLYCWAQDDEGYPYYGPNGMAAAVQCTSSPLTTFDQTRPKMRCAPAFFFFFSLCSWTESTNVFAVFAII